MAVPALIKMGGGEVMGSKPTRCVCDLAINSKKS